MFPHPCNTSDGENVPYYYLSSFQKIASHGLYDEMLLTTNKKWNYFITLPPAAREDGLPVSSSSPMHRRHDRPPLQRRVIIKSMLLEGWAAPSPWWQYLLDHVVFLCGPWLVTHFTSEENNQNSSPLSGCSSKLRAFLLDNFQLSTHQVDCFIHFIIKVVAVN